MTAPSEEHDKYWIRALFADSDTPDYTGKWMLFVPVDQLDTAWAVIKQETEAGRLGISAKVATAKDNPNAASRDVRLICVYTRDSRNLDTSAGFWRHCVHWVTTSGCTTRKTAPRSP